LQGWYVQTPCPALKAELSLYNCYTPTWILFLYTEGLWCPGAIPQEPLPLSRPEWLFCAVCVGHHCHRVGYTLDRYCILLVSCLPWSWILSREIIWSFCRILNSLEAGRGPETLLQNRRQDSRLHWRIVDLYISRAGSLSSFLVN